MGKLSEDGFPMSSLKKKSFKEIRQLVFHELEDEEKYRKIEIQLGRLFWKKCSESK